MITQKCVPHLKISSSLSRVRYLKWHASEYSLHVLEGYYTLLYRVGQLKWGQLTFLMVTFKCIGKIQKFLAHVNHIQQEVVWCKF